MCAKIQIRIGDDAMVKIPISLDFSTMDQSEVVNRDFVDIEVEKTINPIIDYEKVRFTPKVDTVIDEEITSVDIKNLIYSIKMLDDNGAHVQNTTYSDIGFVDDDIKYSKSRFLNTFLRLNFYDNDVLTNQNLISQITIYSKITNAEINSTSDLEGNPLDGGGLPVHVDVLPVRFILNNPIIKPDGFAEGYYIYHFKSDMEIDLSKYLYMRAELNNASNGISTKLMASNRIDLTINELVDKLHTRYILIRTNTGYAYRLDTNYNLEGGTNNITENIDDVTVNLYEIKVV
jgi:hypothetical protein